MTHRPLPLLALVCALPLAACADTPEIIKPYPQAGEGQQRHVIEVPPQANEADYRVELIAGKTLDVDCNQQHLAGQWQRKSVQGWGYDYYELKQVGPAMSTLMACPDDSRRRAFVSVGGEPLLVRYNSTLPLVVYTPVDVQVRYRIWSAAENSSTATKR